jgi:putative hydrolase
MRLFADYHTHTTFSHGKGGVRDNIEHALRRDLSEVGIADHSLAHFTYGIKKGQLGSYIESIEKAKAWYAGRIEVKTGIELNLTGLDGTVDVPGGYKFDILILGYHKAALTKDIKTAWTFMTGWHFGHVESITEAYMRAIQKHRINIVAHPGYGVPVDYRLLGRACADYGTLFEINERHTELKAEDIEAAASEGAAFVISSDAHRPQDVGRVIRALSLARQAGLSAKQIANARED